MEGPLIGEESYKKWEFPTQFYGGGIRIDFWEQDMYEFINANQNAFLSKPVNYGNPAEIRQMALTKAYEMKLNELVKIGDQSVGLQGFIGHKSAWFALAPYIMNSSTSATDMYNLLTLCARGFRNQWGDNIYEYQPNALIVSDDIDYLISSTLYTTTTSVSGNVVVSPQNLTVKEHFLKANSSIERIIPANELNASNLARLGLPNENVIIPLRIDPEKIYFPYSPWRNFPPIQLGTAIVRYGNFATPGVIIPNELAALCLSGWRVRTS
jgi:hypothetical protein